MHFTNFKSAFILAFLSVGFLWSERGLAQDNKNPVYFLLQSASNKNNVVLVKEEPLNILFVSEACTSCFTQLGDLQLKYGDRFIAVTTTKNWNRANKLASRNSVFKKLYSDPGGRFQKSLGLDKTEASFLRISQGKIVGRRDSGSSLTSADPFQLGIWK